jgi:hypothetical protein
MPSTNAPRGPTPPSARPVAVALPLPRPWRFVNGYGFRRRAATVALRLLAFVLLLLGAEVVRRDVEALRVEAEIWHDPAAVELPARFDHVVDDRLGLLPYYRGLVHYTAAGAVQRADLAIATTTRIPAAVPFVVRVRPNAPGAFCSSWQLHARPGRQALLVLFALLLLAFALLPWLLARAFARQLELLHRLQRDGEFVRLPIEREQVVHEHGAPTRVAITVAVAAPTRTYRRHAWFVRRRGGPFRIGDEQVLALWSPSLPGAVLVLREDLWPLQVDPEWQAALRQLHPAAPV